MLLRIYQVKKYTFLVNLVTLLGRVLFFFAKKLQIDSKSSKFLNKNQRKARFFCNFLKSGRGSNNMQIKPYLTKYFLLPNSVFNALHLNFSMQQTLNVWNFSCFLAKKNLVNFSVWTSYTKLENSTCFTTQISNSMKFEFDGLYFWETWTWQHLKYSKYSSQNSPNLS